MAATILHKIIDLRKQDIVKQKEVVSVQDLQQKLYYKRQCFSLVNNLNKQNNSGIIAEFKRASPSKGDINTNAKVNDVVKQYEDFGAVATSILTEPNFFKGKDEDILQVREQISIPILRKDFIVDEYQIYEAKSLGADVILLIAAALSIEEVHEFAGLAKQIGLEVLLEVHNQEELKHDCEFVDMVGVNNRNLKTFEVDINLSIDLFKHLPKNKPAIAESGLSSKVEVDMLKNIGYKGFLIGESLMRGKFA